MIILSIFEKIYNRINWQNKPSTETPINADNLNKMDKAIDDLDGRIVSLLESVDTNTTNISTLQTSKMNIASPRFTGMLYSDTLPTETNKQIIGVSSTSKKVFIGNGELEDLHLEYAGQSIPVRNLVTFLNGTQMAIKICVGQGEYNFDANGLATITLSDTFTVLAVPIVNILNGENIDNSSVTGNIFQIQKVSYAGQNMWMKWIIIGY